MSGPRENALEIGCLVVIWRRGTKPLCCLERCATSSVHAFVLVGVGWLVGLMNTVLPLSRSEYQLLVLFMIQLLRV